MKERLNLKRVNLSHIKPSIPGSATLILVALTSSITIFASSQVTTNSLSFHSMHGTLVLVTPFKDGVILMADKESQIRNYGILIGKRSDRQKIFKLGSDFAGFCTDHTIIFGKVASTSSDGQPPILFDANEEVQRFYLSNWHGNDVRESCTELKNFIASKYLQIANMVDSNDPLRLLRPGQDFLQCGIVRFDRVKRKMDAFTIVLRKPADGSNGIQPGVGNPKESDLATGHPQPFGRMEVWKAILNGGTKEFEQGFNDKPLREYLRKDVRANSVSREEAIQVSASLFKWTHRLLPIVYPDGSVGNNVDVISISKEKGCEWLYRDIPSESLVKRSSNMRGQ